MANSAARWRGDQLLEGNRRRIEEMLLVILFALSWDYAQLIPYSQGLGSRGEAITAAKQVCCVQSDVCGRIHLIVAFPTPLRHHLHEKPTASRHRRQPNLRYNPLSPAGLMLTVPSDLRVHQRASEKRT